MSIQLRDTLKQTFDGRTLPSATDYADLIDSMLNRREDHFFGVWCPGRKYCQGDVVIFGKSLYMLDLPGEVEVTLCKDDLLIDGTDGDNTAKATKQKKEGTESPAPTGCICSSIPPAEDKERWCELQLETDDNDWQITTDAEGMPIVVYNLYAKIGIGTATPATMLEVSEKAGKIQVDAKGAAPTVSLLTETEEACRVDWSVTKKTEYRTDSLGYAFFRLPKTDGGSGDLSKLAKPSTAPAAAPTLLFFLTSEEGRPAAGIGTDEPKGALHVEDENHGRLVVNHRMGNEDATVLLVDCNPDSNGHYLLSGVNQSNAYWQTDASQGLQIIMGGGLGKLGEEMGEGLTAVAIQADGKVGIGTESPRSLLEVNRDKMGSVRVDFSNDNVCISAINGRPQPRPRTYNAIGVNDEFAVQVTDAPSGFAFKAGRACDDNHDHEVDIDQGETVAYLSREGRLGLRTNEPPEEFDLHVNGHQLSQTAYLETNGKRIESGGLLDGGKVLANLKGLRPIYFTWRTGANAHHANDNNDGEVAPVKEGVEYELGRQIGFKAQNVYECFPELTRTLGKDKTVAYGNLTAVLTAAIKEQQCIIEALEKRLSILEDRLNGTDDKDLS